jgi:hypothetical protein
MLVYIVFAHIDPFRKGTRDSWFFAHNSEALGQDNQLVSWDIVLLDRFANKHLASTVRIDISGIPGIEASVVCSFQKWEGLVRQVSHCSLGGPRQENKIN